MLDENGPGEMVLVRISSGCSLWDTDIIEVSEEEDVKVAASLLQVIQEVFHCVHGMEELEAAYYSFSRSVLFFVGLRRGGHIPSKSTLDCSRQYLMSDSP